MDQPIATALRGMHPPRDLNCYVTLTYERAASLPSRQLVTINNSLTFSVYDNAQNSNNNNNINKSQGTS